MHLTGGSKSLHRQFSVDKAVYSRQRTISSCSQDGKQDVKKDLLKQMSVMSNRTMSVDDEAKPEGW
jgi:hypothetical protein